MMGLILDTLCFFFSNLYLFIYFVNLDNNGGVATGSREVDQSNYSLKGEGLH